MSDQIEPTGSPSTQRPATDDQQTDPAPAQAARSGGLGRGLFHQLKSNGKVHVLPHRVSDRLHLPSDVEIVDPRFSTHSHRYLAQSGLAMAAMLAILVFVDSLANAALAAGLGSSVVILFVHPSSDAARPRSVIGGHALALLVGSAFSWLLFASPVDAFLAEITLLRDVGLATSVGLLILVMALTNTEHPPAAGTVLGMALRSWSFQTTGIIIAAVLMMALIKLLMNRHLRDLI